jgi:hypothetical protein
MQYCSIVGFKVANTTLVELPLIHLLTAQVEAAKL